MLQDREAQEPPAGCEARRKTLEQVRTRRWSERLRALNERAQAMSRTYGNVAIVMLLVASAVNVAVFYVAIRFGLGDLGVGTAGTLAAAWAASRPTKPLAVLAAVGLTPLVARLWRRGRSDGERPS